jgi:GT2 family glycosyltransferase
MVSITIVTWNSEKHLGECFASILRQDYPDLQVIVVDNASDDGTRELLHRINPSWQVIYNDANVGFAAGQNQAIRASRGEWVLCLNPDVVLGADFITTLVKAGEKHPDTGSLCGKLLRWNPSGLKGHGFQPRREMPKNSPSGAEGESPQELKPALLVGSNGTLEGVPLPDPRRTTIIDSTGIYFTRNMRHLDRGAEEPDRGQYDRMQYVFGASGAAAFFRRNFIDDVSVEGEFFDEDFFAFREDADLAWRAQVLGWKCLYVPTAVAWHVRRVTPERRRDLPLLINWHSAKNRFLMRGKNASGWLCRRLFFPVAWRDLMTFGYAIVRDRRLWSAVTYWWRARDSIRRKRAIIQSRRSVSDRDLLWWFCNEPRAIDVDKIKGQLRADS